MAAVAITLSLAAACGGEEREAGPTKSAAVELTSTQIVAEVPANATKVLATETALPSEATEVPMMEEPTSTPTVEPTEAALA